MSNVDHKETLCFHFGINLPILHAITLCDVALRTSGSCHQSCEQSALGHISVYVFLFRKRKFEKVSRNGL